MTQRVILYPAKSVLPAGKLRIHLSIPARFWAHSGTRHSSSSGSTNIFFTEDPFLKKAFPLVFGDPAKR
jgi:hypothetical protein